MWLWNFDLLPQALIISLPEFGDIVTAKMNLFQWKYSAEAYKTGATSLLAGIHVHLSVTNFYYSGPTVSFGMRLPTFCIDIFWIIFQVQKSRIGDTWRVLSVRRTVGPGGQCDRYIRALEYGSEYYKAASWRCSESLEKRHYEVATICKITSTKGIQLLFTGTNLSFVWISNFFSKNTVRNLMKYLELDQWSRRSFYLESS